MITPPLGSVSEEAALCRAAWEANPSDWGWHIHHSQLWQARTYSIEDRIRYIETQKPERERALRLRLMRPMIEKDHADFAAIRANYDADCAAIRTIYGADFAAIAAIWAIYDADIAAIRANYDADCAASRANYDADCAAIHQAACPNCPWGGTDIFGGAR